MKLLITDVTEMGGGNYCVAGWDIAAKRMIRLLPNGGNWAGALLRQHGIVTGKLVRVVRQGTSNGTYPHRTEDTAIDATSIKTSNGVFSDWLGASAPQVATSMDTGFSGSLLWNREWHGVKQGAHTLPEVQCSSLVAVRIPRSNLSFSQPFDKLKATLDDGSDRYELAVSSKVLKEAWRDGGVAGVNNALPARDEFHVRVGLARRFQNPPKCYAMLNGVL